MRHDLVDEYVLLIHPLVLGSGRRLFPDDGAFAALRLVNCVTTTTGVMMATYQANRRRTVSREDEHAMKQYLLSIYQPDGETASARVLAKVMRDVNALIDETKAAGVWVFNGGLHPPSTATVVRRSVATCSSPTARSPRQGAHRRVHDHQSAGSRRGARVGAQDCAGAHARRWQPKSGLAIEVRPFQGDGVSSEIERVFREEYGRAVAVLVRHFGDIDVAEEAVQDAFTVAVAAVAVRRRAAEPGGMDHHHGSQPRHRPPAPRGVARGSARPGRPAPVDQRTGRGGGPSCATIDCA